MQLDSSLRRRLWWQYQLFTLLFALVIGLLAWLSVRSRGGSLVLRIEDLDHPKVKPGAAAAAIEDLRWLGLDWDEGPDVGGPCGPYVQSQRRDLYRAALERHHLPGLALPVRIAA